MEQNRNRVEKHKPFWLQFLYLLSLPIVTISLVLMIKFFADVFKDSQRCTEEKGYFQKLACKASETYKDYASYFRIPSDEEMIENFYKHRADFERLAQIYREDSTLSDHREDSPLSDRLSIINKPTPEIKAIMVRVNVAYAERYFDRALWMPSEEAKQHDKTLKFFIFEEAIKGNKFTGVTLRYTRGPVLRLSMLWSGHPKASGYVTKDYYYIPFVPKVENGFLRNQLGGGVILFPTLNRYPPNFDILDCAYRQFEPQWFIKMCQE